MKRHSAYYFYSILAGLLVGLTFLSFSSTAIAAKDSVSLDDLKKSIVDEKSRKTTLEAEVKKEQKVIRDLQKDLVKITGQINENRKNLKSLEGQRSVLKQDRTKALNTLGKDKRLSAELVSMLIRMRRTPPQYFILQDKNIKHFGLMHASFAHSFPILMNHLDDPDRQLKVLDSLERELHEKEILILKEREEISHKESQTKALIVKRKELFEKNRGMIAQHSAQIQKLALQAKTMEELLGRLKTPKPSILAKAHYAPPSMPRRGKKQLPGQGYILTGFGETDPIGAKSQGLRIKADPDTAVIAPMGGIVKFVGSFNTYKNLIIIEHPNDYHSLLSGPEDINVSTGQLVLAGEPIARVSRSQKQETILYYELRHKGRPINPM